MSDIFPTFERRRHITPLHSPHAVGDDEDVAETMLRPVPPPSPRPHEPARVPPRRPAFRPGAAPRQCSCASRVHANRTRCSTRFGRRTIASSRSRAPGTRADDLAIERPSAQSRRSGRMRRRAARDGVCRRREQGTEVRDDRVRAANPPIATVLSNPTRAPPSVSGRPPVRGACRAWRGLADAEVRLLDADFRGPAARRASGGNHEDRSSPWSARVPLDGESSPRASARST